MIKTIISDFSFTLLFSKGNLGKTNSFHEEHKNDIWYKIFDYFELNNELLEILKNFNWKKYIFTTKYIQEDISIKEITNSIFSKTFIWKDLNLSKNDKKSYEFLLNKIWTKPENTLFIDDSIDNIEAAKLAWLQTFLYSRNKNNELEKILIK